MGETNQINILDITPEQFVEMYERAGMRPINGHLVPRDNCCCGMGILAVDKFPNLRRPVPSNTEFSDNCSAFVENLLNSGITHMQRCDFEIGFDTGYANRKARVRDMDAVHDHGFKVGQHVRAHFDRK